MFYKTPWRTENTAETWICSHKVCVYGAKKGKRPCYRGEAMDTIKRTTSKKIYFHVTTDDVAEDDQLEFCQPLDRTQPDEDSLS